jgi:hypothetical protein
LLQRVLRNELRRAVTAMTGGATNTAKTWDTTNGKDPDQDVLNEIVTATDASGVRPNRILYGDGAWTKRLLSHRAQSTAGGYGSAGFNFAELAAWFGVDRVMTSRERYQNSATTKTKVLSDMVHSVLRRRWAHDG